MVNKKLEFKVKKIVTGYYDETNYHLYINGEEVSFITTADCNGLSCCGMVEIENLCDKLTNTRRIFQRNFSDVPVTDSQLLYMIFKATYYDFKQQDDEVPPFWIISMPNSAKYKACFDALEKFNFVKTKLRRNPGSGNNLKVYILEADKFKKTPMLK